MTARQIIEAVVRPNPRTLKAYDRALAYPGAKQRFLKQHKVKVKDTGPSANWQLGVAIPDVFSDPTLLHRDVRNDMAHELVHREQFRRARSKAREAGEHYTHKVGKHGEMFPAKAAVNDKAVDAYLSHPYEVMAYAYDVAQHMKETFGAQALARAKAGQWSDPQGVIAHYPRNTARGRRFLKYVAAYLEPELR